MTERSIQNINWDALTARDRFYPSPAKWEDEVLYFLMVDRFSDGKEMGGFGDINNNRITLGTTDRNTPPFEIATDAYTANRQAWFEAGKNWCGGTLAGLKDKLGYLKRLGITALWLSPIFKQVSKGDSYHGYGIQNFLEVDPHFGTREELKALVDAAHAVGIRVILDIIFNHAGDVFTYEGNESKGYENGKIWPVKGYRRHMGEEGSIPFGPLPLNSPLDEAVWPQELQNPETWTRQGQIKGDQWDRYPAYVDGDFFALKDISHGQASKDPSYAWDVQRRINEFVPAPTLFQLGEIFKYWIAYADIDGFRIDTVKHMEPGASRIFANIIHEFCQSIGKENFYLIGEITGGRQNAVNLINLTGLNAALGINDIPDKLEFLAKGYRNPGNPDTEAQEGYFDLFRNSRLDNKESHQWYASHVITMFDDHDQVGTKHKFRFAGQNDASPKALPAALGLNLLTVGIPCLYYGTEQALNGKDWRSGEESDAYSDIFLRECMFGGPFGSWQSTGRHFFNEDGEFYQLIQTLTHLRESHIELRRGRQYLRSVSENGDGFYYPELVGNELRWVIAWSRIFADSEVLCAVNTDQNNPITVWITVDSSLNLAGRDQMTCLFSTDPAQEGLTTRVEGRNGSAISVTVPPAGIVIYKNLG